jgi:hypothetical protein
MFRSTWPSSGNTKYEQYTWEDISNIKFSEYSSNRQFLHNKKKHSLKIYLFNKTAFYIFKTTSQSRH